jgi:hypothetical protein
VNFPAFTEDGRGGVFIPAPGENPGAMAGFILRGGGSSGFSFESRESLPSREKFPCQIPAEGV